MKIVKIFTLTILIAHAYSVTMTIEDAFSPEGQPGFYIEINDNLGLENNEVTEAHIWRPEEQGFHFRSIKFTPISNPVTEKIDFYCCFILSGDFLWYFHIVSKKIKLEVENFLGGMGIVSDDLDRKIISLIEPDFDKTDKLLFSFVIDKSNNKLYYKSIFGIDYFTFTNSGNAQKEFWLNAYYPGGYLQSQMLITRRQKADVEKFLLTYHLLKVLKKGNTPLKHK
jgi:hypothetical protein